MRDVSAPELRKIFIFRVIELVLVCCVLKLNSVLMIIALLSTPATLEQSYVVCELHEKVNMLFSFLRSHLQKKIIVFFACCKEVNEFLFII